ncbi:MAG: alpha/beta hydrolase [Acidobacteriota bacterium]
MSSSSAAVVASSAPVDPVAAAGTLLAHSCEGPEHGPVVLLLHGITGSRFYWENLAQALQVDHRVVRVDLLGFGESPKPTGRYDLGAHARAVRELMEHLGLTERPIAVIAHSLGALITLEASVRWPGWIERALLVSLPCHDTQEEAHRDFVFGSPNYRRLIGAHSLGANLKSWWAAGPRMALRYLFAFSPRIAADSKSWTLRSLTSTIEHCLLQHRVQDRLAELRDRPVEHQPELLLLHGRWDQVVPPDPAMRLSEQLPRCEGRVIEGTGHHPFRTHFRACHEQTRKFLAGAR